MYSSFRFFSTLFSVLFLVSAAANAQQSRITKPIDNAQRVTLRGHIHPKATAANDQGRVAPSLKIPYITLTLTQSDAQKADLAKLLADQQNPSSPDYHHWLTPQQYADRFGVSTEDIGKIEQWLQGQGLKVEGVAQGRDWVAVSGDAAQVENAFAIEIHHYAVDGETHFANATEPSVPAAIGGMVLSIRGLNDFRPKARVQKPKYTSAHGNHYLAPNDIAAIYDILPAYAAGVNGSGQKIVVAGQSDVPLTDLQNYQAAFNLTGNLPQMVLYGPDPGISSGDQEESDLDLELAGAVAPGATIIFAYSQNVMDAVQKAIDNNLAPVISVSYGSCELENMQSDALTFQSWAQKGNAQGITWFNASGDNGAADCYTGDNTVPPEIQESAAVDLPASVPEITGVGGTAFLEGSATYWNTANNSSGGSALSYIPETSWNTSVTDMIPSASGGGLSVYFPKPSWQTGPGVPGNNMRNVPDIALNASPDHDGYLVYTDGNNSPQVYGGTSCPTPVMAGVAALLNQYLGTGQGNLNPQLYRLAQSSPSVFHDITSGDNGVTVTLSAANCGRRQVCTASSATVPGYTAGAGYDNVTGLGSVDVWQLLTCMKGSCGATTIPPVSISLVTNLNALGPNDSAILTATVTANDGITPVGVVQLTAGTTSLGAITLVGSAGVATASVVVTYSELPSGSATVTASYAGGSTTTPIMQSVSLARAVNSSSNGTPVINGLVDGASFKQTYSPGMILSVFGSSLSPPCESLVLCTAHTLPLPVSMAGVAATVNGVAAPLYYVSPTQLNIQIPWQTTVGAAVLTVNNSGQQASFPPFNVTAASPGIFTDTTGRVVPYGSPAPGDTATLFLAGPGAVTPAVATGTAPAVGTPLSSLPAPANVVVTVRGVQASTTCSASCFVGITPGLVGVVQINFQVPSGTPPGLQPVVVSMNGASSAPNAAFLNVSN
jgi:uncharacterized protein (TIGR03437 family)